jgi:hypothetical protein
MNIFSSTFLFTFRCQLLAATALVCALAACSHGTGDAQVSTAAKSAAVQGNACDRHLLSVADVNGILDAPVTGSKPLPGDAQSCLFITAMEDQGGSHLSVGLRPGLGIATLATFTSGHMNDYATWKPLAGVGDEAVWLPDLHEIQARKGDLLCGVGVLVGMSKTLHDAGEAAQQKALGALCNKIFAAY